MTAIKSLGFKHLICLSKIYIKALAGQRDPSSRWRFGELLLAGTPAAQVVSAARMDENNMVDIRVQRWDG